MYRGIKFRYKKYASFMDQLVQLGMPMRDLS